MQQQSTVRGSKAIVAWAVTALLTFSLAGCGGDDNSAGGEYGGSDDYVASGGGGNAPAPSSIQEDALQSTWDKASTAARQDLCAQFAVDPVGTASDTFSSQFDYDVVKSFLDEKC